MSSSNRISWLFTLCILAAAITASILAAILWTCVPTTALAVVYSSSAAQRFAVWMWPTLMVILPFYIQIARMDIQDGMLFFAACVLCRMVIMGPVAWLIWCQFVPSGTNTANVGGFGFRIDHSLFLWSKVSVFVLHMAWYYAIFRFVKCLTSISIWAIYGVLLFGALSLEVVFVFWNSSFLGALATLLSIIAIILGISLEQKRTGAINCR